MHTPPVIALILSSQKYLDNAQKFLELRGCHVHSLVADLEQAVRSAKQLLSHEPVDIILSRRGTAHILQEHLSVPVMSMPDNIFNHIKALREAMALGSRVGITLYDAFEYDMDFYAECLGVAPEIIQYTTTKDMDAGLRRAADRGVEVVVGGDITRRLAAKYGLKTVDIHTWATLTERDFNNIKHIVETRRATLQATQSYKAIFNSVREGIISINAQGNITDINTRAAELLQTLPAQSVGKPLQHFLPRKAFDHALRWQKAITNVTVSVHDKTVMVNTTPVSADGKILGCVCSVQSASSIMQAEERVRQASAKGLKARYSFKDFLCCNRNTQLLLEQAALYAASDATVCITGESGTGKEILAQAIHSASLRRNGPFVAVNCGALPETLLESELFGHTEGAFTGSLKGGKAGLFELAQGGTLFLDEIGVIPPAFQIKLLRALQEREIRRLGSHNLIPVDVRVVSASNEDLLTKVRKGDLRGDLYFRLHVLPVHIAPLRERQDDIPLLLQAFLEEFAKQYKRETLTLPPSVLEQASEAYWPGNVRQLRSFAERLCIAMPEGFSARVFPYIWQDINQGMTHTHAAVHPPKAKTAPAAPLSVESVRAALEQCQNGKNQAAQLLNVSRSTLWRFMKTHDHELSRDSCGDA